MFFVFSFLLLSIYFPESNNFVLKKENQDFHFKQNGKDLIFQDVQNDSLVFPTRKSVLHIIQNLTKTKSRNPRLNHFNKKISAVVPIKRHIQDNDDEDTPSLIKNTKSNIATSGRELKRKWPVVELLTHSDNLNENSQYVDDSEQKEIAYLHDIEKEFKVRQFTPKYISKVDLHNNHSKDKPIGLRSLPQRKYFGINCNDGDQCVCSLPEPQKSTTTSKATTTRPFNSQGIDMGFPMGIPLGVPMGVHMGVPMGIPAGYPPGIAAGYAAGFPAGFPAGYAPAIPGGPMPYAPGLPSFYQANTCKEVPKHKKPSKTHSNDYLYYEDDGDDDEPENSYEYDEDSIEKKRKHKKQHKGDIFINVEYDIEEKRDKKTTQSSKCRQNQEDFSKIFNDRKPCDTVIKDWYCCTASSCRINFQLVFLLLILAIFC